MLEDYLRDYLDNHLSAPVYISVPKEHPKIYYVIEKTGSTRADHIWESVFAIQAYGESFAEASDMIDEVNALMLDELISESRISKVSLNASLNFTDTTQKQPRYQSVFVINHY